MKTLRLATLLLLAIASPGRSKDKETNKALEALFARATPIYQEEFNKLVEAGEFEPKLNAKSRWKEGTLQGKLYLAGYYSAVMSYMEPSIFKEREEVGGLVEPYGYGAKLSYAFGWWAGLKRVDPVARKLHRQIVAKLLEEDEKAAAKASQDPQPSSDPKK
jgi:hypothetical protein